MSGSGPLAGRRIVVTRAADQAGTLTTLLTEAGAMVIEVPTIAIVEPADGGAAQVGMGPVQAPWEPTPGRRDSGPRRTDA